MSNKDDAIRLDDSILEENESKIEKEEKKSINKLEKEISLDDLFDFKPIGTVGNEDKFLNETFNKSSEPKKTHTSPLSKKQALESILDEPEEPTFIDETKDNILESKPQPTPQPKKEYSSFRESMKNQKEDVTLFDEEVDKEKTPVANEPLNLDLKKCRSLIESAMYVCGNEGLSIADMKRLTNASSSEIKKIMKDWNDELDADDTRGITIKNYGERYKLFSKTENREDLSRLITIKYRNPLSSKVMETLAIIAYNQPCTRAIIEDIRAKDPTATIQKLIELGLVIEAGRADSPGRPLLYTVTHKFYDIFGIKNLSELPKINVDQPFEDQDVSFFDTTRFND